jgi:Ca2+/Na+ antiporter
MIADILMATLGLVILLLAGDSLVKGAVNLALRIGIPALLVSLTIVAFGTSAPELLISIAAIKDDAAGLALGNVVGSNTANILLILGIPAILAGLDTEGCDTRKSYAMMMVASVLFIALAFFGPFTWWHGIILLAGLSVVLGDTFRDARAHRRDAAGQEEEEDVDLEGVDDTMPGWKVAAFLVLGLVGLPLGADILVDAATSIAEDLGVQRYGDRPDAGGHRHLAARTGDDRHGRDPAAGGRGAGQRDRLQHLQPARDHRDLELRRPDPSRSQILQLRSLGYAGGLGLARALRLPALADRAGLGRRLDGRLCRLPRRHRIGSGSDDGETRTRHRRGQAPRRRHGAGTSANGAMTWRCTTPARRPARSTWCATCERAGRRAVALRPTCWTRARCEALVASARPRRWAVR